MAVRELLELKLKTRIDPDKTSEEQCFDIFKILFP